MICVEQCSDVSIVFGFYNSTLFYLGKVPEYVSTHLTKHGTITPIGQFKTSNITVLAISPSMTTRRVTISLDAWNNQLSSTNDCGQWTIPSSLQNVEINIECNENTEFSGTGIPVLSARALTLSVSLTDTVSLFTPELSDINHWRQTSTLIMLCIFVCLWLDWTHNLFGSIVETNSKSHKIPTAVRFQSKELPTASDTVWNETCVSYFALNTSLLLLILSINTWSALEKTKNLDSFTIINLIGEHYANIYSYYYGYGVTLYLVFISWVLMMYGNLMYTAPENLSDSPIFSFGLSRVGRLEAHLRVILFLFILGFVMIISEGLWVATVGNAIGGIVTLGITAGTVLYMSSSVFINNKLATIFMYWYKEDVTLLVLMRSAFEILIITSINNLVPFTFGGALTFDFHTLATAVICSMLMYAVGRDTAYIWLLTNNKYILLLQLLHVSIAILSCILFGIGGVFVTSGALRNLPLLALAQSRASTFVIFSLSFAWTIKNVADDKDSKHVD